MKRNIEIIFVGLFGTAGSERHCGKKIFKKQNL
jgi:hypothetical protein